MKSMTGFGRSEVSDADSGIGFTVEISSVNRKQLETNIYIPREISGYEQIVRKVVKSKLKRGSVTVRAQISYTSAADAKVSINRDVAAAYLQKIVSLQKELSLPGEITISELINLPNVISEETALTESDTTKQLFEQAVSSAVDSLTAMRSDEGAELYDDICRRLDSLASLIDRLEPMTADIPAVMQNKLMANLEEAGLPVDLEDQRILKEIVIFSDKSDVSEEITRLKSHFIQFRKIMDRDNEAIGRSLDFMTQELYREINTLGNKAAGTGTSPLVVQFKTELEKIREQVQNVE